MPTDRPNILVLMSDHTNAQALAPHSPCRTPNLDGLVAGGAVRFGRCYTTNAICSPARASLMTGTYPSTHGMWDCTHTQRREWVNVSDRLTYWSQPLAAAGYRMGYFGKWHVEQTLRLQDFGWGEYDLSCHSARPEVVPGSEVVVRNPGYRPYRLAAAAKDDSVASHPAFEAGIDFLRRAAGGDEPFCCFVSTAEPHDPYIPPERFLNMYDPAVLPVSPTLRDELAGKPEVLRRMQSVWKDLSDDDWRTISACYWALISFLDHEVGRILGVLEEIGAAENTIVVVTSDHGDMLGGHGLAAKGVGTSYEEVYNIPLLMRAPGLTAGREDNAALVSLVDVGPTLLDLCGLEPMQPCHGRSLRPVLDGSAETAGWQDAYGEFFGQRFVYTQRIVWHGPWKYVFSPGGVDELYNLADDPHERVNLAADAARRPVLEDMARRMWRKMKAIGDESLFNTNYATLRTAPIGPLSIEDR